MFGPALFGGLTPAIKAEEGVKVQKESVTITPSPSRIISGCI